MWALLERKDHDFADQILDWGGLALEVITATPDAKQELISKRDSALQKAKDTQKSIRDDTTF